MAGMGKVALNEWLLSGWRTDDLNGRLWAAADRQLLEPLNSPASHACEKPV